MGSMKVITQFMELCSVNQEEAELLLQKSHWDIDEAVNRFYEHEHETNVYEEERNLRIEQDMEYEASLQLDQRKDRCKHATERIEAFQNLPSEMGDMTIRLRFSSGKMRILYLPKPEVSISEFIYMKQIPIENEFYQFSIHPNTNSIQMNHSYFLYWEKLKYE